MRKTIKFTLSAGQRHKSTKQRNTVLSVRAWITSWVVAVGSLAQASGIDARWCLKEAKACATFQHYLAVALARQLIGRSFPSLNDAAG